jgi:hypothetical protein
MIELKKMSGEELVRHFEKFHVSLLKSESMSELSNFVQDKNVIYRELLLRLNDYDRLKQIMKDAPHDEKCSCLAHTRSIKWAVACPLCVPKNPCKCTCWKKEITP